MTLTRFIASATMLGLAATIAMATQPPPPVAAPTLPTPEVAAKSVQDWFDHAVTDILSGVAQALPDPQPKPADRPRAH